MQLRKRKEKGKKKEGEQASRLEKNVTLNPKP